MQGPRTIAEDGPGTIGGAHKISRIGDQMGEIGAIQAGLNSHMGPFLTRTYTTSGGTQGGARSRMGGNATGSSANSSTTTREN